MTRNFEAIIQSVSTDEAQVIELLHESRQIEDAPVTDVIRLRSGNPHRLGGAAIRQAVSGTRTRYIETDALKGEWISVPDGGEQTSILYFHGGAYVRGSLLQGRGMASALALGVGGRAFAVDYGQAPEHPFPGPIHDGVQAYLGLLAEGIDPGSIAIAGDSCGGAIVVAILLALRDAGMALPAAAVSISPWADLTFSGASWQRNAEKDLIRPQFSSSAAKIYLAGADPTSALASPAFADLRGLPPLLVIAGEDEVLYSDALALAEAADRGGVDVTLRTYTGMIHVFPMFNLRTGDIALEGASRFIAEKTRRETAS